MSKSFLHTAPNKISSTNMTVSDTFITYLMAYSDELAEIFFTDHFSALSEIFAQKSHIYLLKKNPHSICQYIE